jgi:hypothetical protein
LLDFEIVDVRRRQSTKHLVQIGGEKEIHGPGVVRGRARRWSGQCRAKNTGGPDRTACGRPSRRPSRQLFVKSSRSRLDRARRDRTVQLLEVQQLRGDVYQRSSENFQNVFADHAIGDGEIPCE